VADRNSLVVIRSSDCFVHTLSNLVMLDEKNKKVWLKFVAHLFGRTRPG